MPAIDLVPPQRASKVEFEGVIGSTWRFGIRSIINSETGEPFAWTGVTASAAFTVRRGSAPVVTITDVESTGKQIILTPAGEIYIQVSAAASAQFQPYAGQTLTFDLEVQDTTAHALILTECRLHVLARIVP